MPAEITSSSAIDGARPPLLPARHWPAWKFIPQGDDLATRGRQRFRRLETGYEWESDFAHIITLRAGRWLHFRDFMNSALTLQAFSR